jgi:hypothetical protein
MGKLKCPHCARDFVRRISRAGLLESVLSCFYVYPFKCQLCGHRFRSLQWGVSYVRSREDPRDYTRMERELPITFSGDGLAGDGTLLDISMSGCSFTIGADLPVGTVVRLGLQIAGDIPPVTIDAAVVRHGDRRAAGVEFIRWQESERERLQLFIRGMLIGQGTEADRIRRTA